jgi:hypothetical protein
MMRTILAAALALSVVSCAQVDKFTLTDISNAGAIATAAGDTAGADCWAPLGAAVGAATAPTPSPQDDGVAVLIERTRLGAGLQAVAMGPCAPVIVQGLLKAGKLGL